MAITLKAARVNAGLTQQEAAEKLNISKKTLGLWEQGKVCPKVNKVNDICNLYTLDYDDIIFLQSDNA